MERTFHCSLITLEKQKIWDRGRTRKNSCLEAPHVSNDLETMQWWRWFRVFQERVTGNWPLSHVLNQKPDWIKAILINVGKTALLNHKKTLRSLEISVARPLYLRERQGGPEVVNKNFIGLLWDVVPPNVMWTLVYNPYYLQIYQP